MTVTTTTRQAVLTTNGSTTVFPFSFKVLNAAHVTVQLRNATTKVVEKTYTAGEYTLSGVGASSGSVTISPAPAAGKELVIVRTVPYTQEVDIVNQGGFFPEVIENQLDLNVMQTQQLQAEVDRAPRVQVGEVGPTFISLPNLVGETLGLQSDGNGGYQIVAGVTGQLAGVIEVTGGSFSLSANHAFNFLSVNHGSNLTVTIPAGLMDVGAYVELYQKGFGRFTIAGASGVTVRSRGNLFQSAGTHAIVGLRKIGVDEWVVAGDVS